MKEERTIGLVIAGLFAFVGLVGMLYNLVESPIWQRWVSEFNGRLIASYIIFTVAIVAVVAIYRRTES